MMRRSRWHVALIGSVLSLFVVSSILSAQLAAGRLHVHFIDVGQADGILMMDDAKRCVILIDSGDTRYPNSASNFKAYLSKHVPTGGEINLAVVSHPHNDHLGSMQWVLENYRVKTYIDNGQPYPSRIYDNLMAVVRQQRQQHLEYYPYASVPGNKDAVCGPNGPRAHVLYPQSGLDPEDCTQNANNCSVVMKLTFGQTSFLFPGDAEEEEEEILLKDARVKAELRATVLKVPHHGSDTSSSADFLDAVRPSLMVISAGKKDVGTNARYKHPRLSTVQRLLGFAGARTTADMIDVYDAAKRQWTQLQIWGGLHVTAKDGTIVLSTDGSAVKKN